MNGGNFRIQFPTMKLSDKMTGEEFDVRRGGAGGSATPSGPWHFISDRGAMVPMPADVSSDLSAAVSRGDAQYHTSFGRFRYEFDLAANSQRNLDTGKVRRIVPPTAAAVSVTVPAPAPVPQRAAAGPGAGAGSGAARPVGPAGIVHDFAAALESTTAEAAVAAEANCCVCMSDFDAEEEAVEDWRKLSKCNHFFHTDCIQGWLARRPTCPTCQTSYGVIRGTQPEGRMAVRTFPPGQVPLSGHEREGTIVIEYDFPNGVQGPEHPSPGSRYAGTRRSAYLPDSAEGRRVLRLLETAWERRLLFRVGRSMTTGRDNCVVWATVHHKTNTHGGTARYGYPDPTYFARVTDELKAVGVVE